MYGNFSGDRYSIFITRDEIAIILKIDRSVVDNIELENENNSWTLENVGLFYRIAVSWHVHKSPIGSLTTSLHYISTLE
jgi:hypothetical protein